MTRTASKKAFWYRLRELGHATYGDYLRSEHWAEFRERYAKSKWRGVCKACYRRVGAFELHHKTYVRLGSEWLQDVVGLCHDCHAKVHAAEATRPDKVSLLRVTRVTVRKERKKAIRRQASEQSARAKARNARAAAGTSASST